MDECMHGWMIGWLDGLIDGWTNGWVNDWDGWMGGWTDGWMAGWLHVRMDRSLDVLSQLVTDIERRIQKKGIVAKASWLWWLPG